MTTAKKAPRGPVARFSAKERATLEPLIVAAAVAAVRQAKAYAVMKEAERDMGFYPAETNHDRACKRTRCVGEALADALSKVRGKPTTRGDLATIGDHARRLATKEQRRRGGK